MKRERLIDSQSGKVDAFITHLARKDAGSKACAGYSCRKMLTGMNGQKKKVTITIEKLQPGAYEVSFSHDRGSSLMKWRWRPEGEKTRIVYEEKNEMPGLFGTLNAALGGLLFGYAARKQMAMRLDAFEKELEAFEWQG